jgi:carbon starvation protein
MVAGWQKLFHEKASISFLKAAGVYQKAIESGQLLAPAKSVEEMQRIVLNNQIDAILTVIFMILVAVIIIDAVRVWYKILVKREKLPLKESPYIGHQSEVIGG